MNLSLGSENQLFPGGNKIITQVLTLFITRKNQSLPVLEILTRSLVGIVFIPINRVYRINLVNLQSNRIHDEIKYKM